MAKNYLFALLAVLFCLSAQAQVFTDSNLPIVIIDTDVNPNTGQPQEIPDDPRVMANMKIIKRPDGTRNYLTDTTNPAFLDYDGRISIELRGSSSQTLPKKGYGLTTLQADDVSNNNVPLLGMPEENDWILNALAYDPSLIRDHISYKLSGLIGNYAPRTAYCEVMVNGEYRGLYLMQEKIKADSDRVNILKMTPSDNALPQLTGGYITKADKLTGGDPLAWTMLSYNGVTDYIHEQPKPEDITTQQHNYIQSRFQALAATANFNNTAIAGGYPSIIDIPSFVDFMVINELSSNADAYQLSTFFHQDRGGKLRAGPVWDINLSYGNDLFAFGLDRSHYDVWQFDNLDNTGSRFWKDLFQSPAYRCQFARRWNALTQPGQPIRHNSLVQMIDAAVALIAEAAIRENQKWATVPNLAGEIDDMKLFLYNRINWMNANIGSFAACANPVLPPLVISRINYNPNASGPYSSNDSEFVEITNTGATSLSLAGIYLREPGVNFQFAASASVAAGSSIFLASNTSAFQARYGISAIGQFTRNLPNSTHPIVLADAWGNVIDSVVYDDDAPWPDADGNGQYLQLISTELDNSLAENWIATGSSLATDAFAGEGFAVYPMPVSDWLHVDGASQIARFTIADAGGKQLESNPMTADKIDFSKYSSGFYFLKIEDVNGNVRTGKVIRK